MSRAHNAPSRADAQPELRWLRVLVWAFGLLAIGIGCAQVVFYFPRTVDDLFISLRYAEHLAAGWGLVYNPGERVEGFSSPLWVVLQSVGLRLGGDGVTVTKLWSVASLVLLLGCAFQYARRIYRISSALAWLVVAGLAANSYLLSWALLGLETPLYLALLLGWPLALRHHLLEPSWRTAAAAIFAGAALGLVRPEAPPYAATLLLGVSLSRVGASPASRRLRRLARIAAPVTVLLVLFELGRRTYFGAWLPHTYYAKRSPGFDLDQLLALVSWGAHPGEVICLMLAVCAAGWLAMRRRDCVPLCCVLTNAAFVCSVAEDWMPNQRHYLPIWVYMTLAVGAVADRLVRAPGRWRFAAVLPGAALFYNGVQQCQIDSRFSRAEFRTHGRGQNWVRVKTRLSWHDSWLALRRRTPPHVARMRVSSMGMIQQLYRILETSRRPESESWYVGRDIGRVGYYSPIRIFDTDGLFTPDVVRDSQWRRSGRVSAELARRAFAREPIGAEVFGRWSLAVGEILPELGGYDVLSGSRRQPVVLRRRGERPTPEQILRRYGRAAARFPSWFYLSTLYGECVGAAFEKRQAHVRAMLQGQASSPGTEAAAGIGARHPASVDNER
jgi:hypothetical protein